MHNGPILRFCVEANKLFRYVTRWDLLSIVSKYQLCNLNYTFYTD